MKRPAITQYIQPNLNKSNLEKAKPYSKVKTHSAKSKCTQQRKNKKAVSSAVLTPQSF